MNDTLKVEAMTYKYWVLRDRQICDLEMIMNGAFAPLNGFLGKNDYENVLSEMRLENGSLWPLPIMLDIDKEFSKKLTVGDKVTLKDKEGFSIAIIKIDDIWEPDLNKEAELVFGTKDCSHPGVDYLINQTNSVYIGGKIKTITIPRHYDYENLRQTPSSLKKKFEQLGWENVVAFQTRNPLHRAHVEMTLSALEEFDANLLIHPVVGVTKPGDVDHYTRVRCYKHVLSKYPDDKAFLSLIPLAMRMAGPREALCHAIIRKNYGCSHFIVGRDHAGPGLDSNGKPFYGPYAAQEILKQYEEEIGIKMVPFKFLVYLPDVNRYIPIDEVARDTNYITVSGTELRDLLDKGKDIPNWFTYSEVEMNFKNLILQLQRGGSLYFLRAYLVLVNLL